MREESRGNNLLQQSSRAPSNMTSKGHKDNNQGKSEMGKTIRCLIVSNQLWVGKEFWGGQVWGHGTISGIHKLDACSQEVLGVSPV
jgi:hypothetical protein